MRSKFMVQAGHRTMNIGWTVISSVALLLVLASACSKNKQISCSDSSTGQECTCYSEAESSSGSDLQCPLAQAFIASSCIARGDWPDGKGTCTCLMGACHGSASGCRCDFYDLSPKDIVDTCSDTPSGDGGTFQDGQMQCCLASCSAFGGVGCFCDPNKDPNTPCGSDYTNVADCNAELLVKTKFGCGVAGTGDYRVVDGCNAGSNSGSGGGEADSGTTPACTSKGVCGPTEAKCYCGYDCLSLGPGRYDCGFNCTTDADCTGKSDPMSGKPFTSCSPGENLNGIQYDGLCIE